MIELIVVLIIVAFAIWAIGLIPMDARLLMFIRGLAILCALIWVLQFFGLANFHPRRAAIRSEAETFVVEVAQPRAPCWPDALATSSFIR